MDNLAFILPFVAAFAILIAIRILAGQPHFIGRLCRWFWNISFKVISFVPFFGWMTCFMIADTKEEKASKAHYQEIGRQADQIGEEFAANVAAKQRAEEEARQERLALERAINHKLKRTDARIINENVVEIGGKKYTLESVRRKLDI